jgi:hypothetical protein
MVRDRREGQASVELLAGIPVLVLAGLVALQLLAAGYSLTTRMAPPGRRDGARRRQACGRPTATPRRGGRATERRRRRRRALTVRLQPPSPLSAVAHELAVSSSTWVRRPDG